MTLNSHIRRFVARLLHSALFRRWCSRLAPPRADRCDDLADQLKSQIDGLGSARPRPM